MGDWTRNIIALLGLLLIVLVVQMVKYSGRLKGFLSVVIHRIHALYRWSPLFHAAGRMTSDRRCPSGLPPLALTEKVSEITWRVLGMNPGSHTLQGTNTWLIGSGDERILIDTGEDITAKAYTKLLLDVVFPSLGCKRLSKIILTHGHGDHQGKNVANFATNNCYHSCQFYQLIFTFHSVTAPSSI